MDILESVVHERFLMFDRVRALFETLYPERPKRLKRGPVQEQILEALNLRDNSFSRRNINEAMSAIGYRASKIRGYLYFSKAKHNDYLR